MHQPVDGEIASHLYVRRMSDRLQELSAFVRAAEAGSFSRVARELAVSQPSISRMVARLEARLGVKLLLRTTRHVTPTDAGAAFLERARQVLGDLDDAEDAARGLDSLRGMLRIAMPGAFATREIIPSLPGFLALHPRLRLDLVISDRMDDLVAEGVDMAVRLGRLADSGFGGRLLATSSRLAVATRSYLAARGEPLVPAELSAHDCIIGPGLSGRGSWRFTRDGAVMSVAVEGRVQVASAEGVIACAKAGLGIAVASHWMCRAELSSGELVAILPDYRLEPVDVHAVYPGGRRPSLKLRAFSDYLAAELAPRGRGGEKSGAA
jgi:DNA-binding transcriptional LysR family regulator